jgi:peptide/nickel transport system substrate-binding protein
MREAGTLTMLLEPEPPTLVALTNCGDPSMFVSAKVTEGLLSYAFDLSPRPQLATAWSVSPDSREFTFRLREGVRWHDGPPFTSRDVASSVALLRELHGRGRTTFANVTAVRTPDPLTAVIALSRPAPFLLHALAGSESPMTPAHLYGSGDAQANPNGAKPIGTGPYVFREWARGSHLVYGRNPHYWDSPKPYVDKLVVRFIENPQEKLAALEAGAIDLAPGTPVPLDAMRRIEANPGLCLVTDGYQYTNQVVRLEFNLDHPVLGRRAVRQAIAHSLDRRAIIDQAWLGYGEPAVGPISPDLKHFHARDLPAPEFDPAAAERILDAAGLPRGADGVRLRLPLDYVPAGDGYRRTAECVTQALDAVGIAADVRVQDFPSYIRRIYTDRDFAFAVSRMNNMFDPTVGVQRVFWSKNFRPGIPFSNGSHYVSAEADDLLERAAVEADPTTRIDLFRSFQRRVIEDLPDLTLLAPKQITIASRRISDHTVTADGIAGNLADVCIRGEPGNSPAAD